MLWRNLEIWRKCLVCKASSFTSDQTRWYNKIILTKRLFSSMGLFTDWKLQTDLISNGLDGVNNNLGLCYKFLCSIFSKGTKLFDFMKRNIVWRLVYKVKCISHINEGLIMFFGNSRIRFFKIGWLDCGQCRKNQYRKTERD